MPIRSYVDLSLFVRFIHVRPGNLSPEVESLLEAGAQRDAWVTQFANDLGTSFHEMRPTISGQGSAGNWLPPLAEKSGLRRCILGVVKVAQTNAN
jgi:hypothetical protein